MINRKITLTEKNIKAIKILIKDYSRKEAMQYFKNTGHYLQQANAYCPLCLVNRETFKNPSINTCKTCPWIIFEGDICLKFHHRVNPLEDRIKRLQRWLKEYQKC